MSTKQPKGDPLNALVACVQRNLVVLEHLHWYTDNYCKHMLTNAMIGELREWLDEYTEALDGLHMYKPCLPCMCGIKVPEGLNCHAVFKELDKALHIARSKCTDDALRPICDDLSKLIAHYTGLLERC